MVKENQWVGKNVDLKLLSQRLIKFFEDYGFKQIRSEEDPNGSWYEIQARKTGVLRTLGSSRKAIHINIKGNPSNFEVEMGVGEWGKNIAVAAMLTGGIGLIGLGFDAAFKNKLWKYIQESVDSLTNSQSVTSSQSTVNNPQISSHTTPSAEDGIRQSGEIPQSVEEIIRLLKIRLAKGEITEEEYLKLKNTLEK